VRGYPLDLTFYQTIKGITAAQHVVKPGGRILVLGECAEGIGSPDFAAQLRGFTGNEAYLSEIAHSTVIPDQWQLEKLALVGLTHEVLFYTPGVSPADLGALGSHCFSDLNQAVNRLLDGLPVDARIALIPEGHTPSRKLPPEPDLPAQSQQTRTTSIPAACPASPACRRHALLPPHSGEQAPAHSSAG